MAKPLSFKDFIVVDYLPGQGEYINYQAKKRKRSDTEESVQTEALTHAQRIKASIRMKKMKARIKLGRQRALRKTPDMETVKKRARKKARLLVLKRLTRGQSKSDISFARRQSLEKKLDKMGPRIERIAKKLIPDIRKIDRERKKAASQSK